MLVTLNEIKTYLEIPLTDTSKDAKLEMLGTLATNLVETLCNRNFAVRKYKDVYNTENSSQVFLRHYPISDITSIVYLGTDLLLSDFVIDKDRGVLELIGFSAVDFNITPRRFTTFAKNTGALEIIYTSGFDILPEGVKLVVLANIAKLHNSGKYAGISSLSIGDFKISTRETLSTFEMAMLTPYIIREDNIDLGTSEDITDEVIPS